MANDPPVGGPPIALSPETYDRHDQAARYVEEIIRTRAPRPDRSRFPGLAPGAWGLLASGHSITAASGTSLGSGSVNLCDRAGTDSGESVTVYNAGITISASGGAKIVRLGWTGGDWSVTCPGA